VLATLTCRHPVLVPTWTGTSESKPPAPPSPNWPTSLMPQHYTVSFTWMPQVVAPVIEPLLIDTLVQTAGRVPVEFMDCPSDRW
jgi:hypothetical protein